MARRAKLSQASVNPFATRADTAPGEPEPPAPRDLTTEPRHSPADDSGIPPPPGAPSRAVDSNAGPSQSAAETPLPSSAPSWLIVARAVRLPPF
jgi:hypothetical protein